MVCFPPGSAKSVFGILYLVQNITPMPLAVLVHQKTQILGSKRRSTPVATGADLVHGTSAKHVSCLDPPRSLCCSICSVFVALGYRLVQSDLYNGARFIFLVRKFPLNKAAGCTWESQTKEDCSLKERNDDCKE